MADLPPIQRCAAGGEFTLKVSVDNGRLWRPGMSVPTDGGKRGKTTKVFFPLLTPQTFLWTRRPSVARLKARGPQMRLVVQGFSTDRSGAFRSDGANALHRMAAHCYARQITRADLRTLQLYIMYSTPGTEPP